jgi:adenine-specific DNA methylase
MTNHTNPNNNNPSELAGLPKSVGLGEQKKRFSAQVAAGHAHIEGDMTLGKKCITALRSGGEFTRATQNFHAYPARLHPEAGRLLLEALPGKTLADPFCGGGTILVEALIAGRTVFGSDLNPIATLVTTARTALLYPEQLQRLQADLADICARADEKLAKGANVHLPPTILKYKDWYKTNCFNELACLYNEIDKRQSELKPL